MSQQSSTILSHANNQLFCTPRLIQEFFLASHLIFPDNSDCRIDAIPKITEPQCIRILQECTRIITEVKANSKMGKKFNIDKIILNIAEEENDDDDGESYNYYNSKFDSQLYEPADGIENNETVDDLKFSYDETAEDGDDYEENERTLSQSKTDTQIDDSYYANVKYYNDNEGSDQLGTAAESEAVTADGSNLKEGGGGNSGKATGTDEDDDGYSTHTSAIDNSNFYDDFTSPKLPGQEPMEVASRQLTILRRSKSIREARLLERAKKLEMEIQGALNDLALTSSDTQSSMNIKFARLNEIIRKEKILKYKLQDKVSHLNRKVQMLMDHIEKLMRLMKFEASHKSKMAQVTNDERERREDMMKHVRRYKQIINAKDKLIRELNESNKVLDTQLQLMSEQFVELKSRLQLQVSNHSHFMQQTQNNLARMKHGGMTEEERNSLNFTPIGKVSNHYSEQMSPTPLMAKPANSASKNNDPNNITYTIAPTRSKNKSGGIFGRSDSPEDGYTQDLPNINITIINTPAKHAQDAYEHKSRTNNLTVNTNSYNENNTASYQTIKDNFEAPSNDFVLASLQKAKVRPDSKKKDDESFRFLYSSQTPNAQHTQHRPPSSGKQRPKSASGLSSSRQSAFDNPKYDVLFGANPASSRNNGHSETIITHGPSSPKRSDGAKMQHIITKLNTKANVPDENKFSKERIDDLVKRGKY